jgi:broad specificity phosphatase PhoE
MNQESMKRIIISLAILTCVNLSIGQVRIPFTKSAKVFIVRHAEKQDGDDPQLTDDGKKRAGDLMRKLRNEKIKRIYVTEFKRTQQTGDSLQLKKGIDTIQVKADTNCISLFTAVKKHKDWNKPILIITHSNIIQNIIYKLGITTFPQRNIPANEFDNLYIITFKKGKPVLKHSKYGKPSGASALMMQ